MKILAIDTVGEKFTVFSGDEHGIYRLRMADGSLVRHGDGAVPWFWQRADAQAAALAAGAEIVWVMRTF